MLIKRTPLETNTPKRSLMTLTEILARDKSDPAFSRLNKEREQSDDEFELTSIVDKFSTISERLVANHVKNDLFESIFVRRDLGKIREALAAIEEVYGSDDPDTQRFLEKRAT